MLGEELTEFFETGSAQVVGLVDVHGDPVAARGCGMAVDREDPTRFRLFVPVDDYERLGYPADDPPEFAIAVTGARVATLESYQVKGTVQQVEPPTDEDHDAYERYLAAFFRDVHVIDGFPLEIMERWRPKSFVTAVVAIHEVYDQTPGPGAGRLVERVER